MILWCKDELSEDDDEKPIISEYENIQINHLHDVRESLLKLVTDENAVQNYAKRLARPVACHQKREPEIFYRIPQHLHFVWISKNQTLSNPMSSNNLWSIGTFCKMNPEYQVNLWMDNLTYNSSIKDYFQTIDCPNFELSLIKEEEIINKSIYENLDCVGARSDIVRYDIVYRFGGIYLDVDSIAIQPFSRIFQESFVTYVPEGYQNICNCLFGFPKGSKFLKYLLGCMNENYNHIVRAKMKHKGLDYQFTGPDFMTLCFLNYNDSRVKMIHHNYLLQYHQPNVMYQLFSGSWMPKRK